MIRRIGLAIVLAAPATGIACFLAAMYEFAPFQRLREGHISWALAGTLILIPLLVLASVSLSARSRRRRWRDRYGFEPPVRVDQWESTREAIFAAEVVAPMFWIIPVTLGLLAARTYEVAVYVFLLMLVFGLLARRYRAKAADLSRTIVELLEQHHRPCMTCGYDLTPGNLERCPECGTPRENPR